MTEPEYPPLREWPSAEDIEAMAADDETTPLLADSVVHRRLRAIAGADYAYIYVRVPKGGGEATIDISEEIDEGALPAIFTVLAQVTS